MVATHERELPQLDFLETRGKDNGLAGIKRLTSEEIKEYEPYVTAIAGLLVPQTGIVDYEKVTQAFASILQQKGGEIRLNHRVTSISVKDEEIVLETNKNPLFCRQMINCAGLQSDRIARMSGMNPSLKIIPFRGEYFDIVPKREYLVKGLIYPVPDPQFPFLGVHFTRMIKGGVEAGPNAVLAFKREGYKKTSFSLSDFFSIMLYPGALRLFAKHSQMGLKEMYRSWNKSAFTAALQKMIPEIHKDDLIPGGSGVRAQALERNGFLVDDFRIVGNQNIINVLNTPSPAATASISIGETIAQMACKNFGIKPNH